MENQTPSAPPSGGRYWRIYLLMVVALVASLVVMNVADLRVRGPLGRPTSSAVDEAIRTGDIAIRQALVPLQSIDKPAAVRTAIQSYRKAGKDPDALRRIGVAQASLLQKPTTREFEKLSAHHPSEAKMWMRIYGHAHISSNDAASYVAVIRKLDLGPLKDLAISDAYKNAGLTAKAQRARKAAETAAMTTLFSLGALSMLLFAAGVTGLVLGIVFLNKYGRALRTAPHPAIQPTVVMICFLVYLVSYLMFGVVAGSVGSALGYDQASPVGAALDLLLQMIAMFGSLALASSAFANMLVITKEDYREIGLNFRNLGNKIAWGFGAYCTALPVLGVTALMSRGLMETVFRHIETPEHPIVPTVVEGGLPLAMAFLVAVVAAPIVEEIAFRGFLYTSLRGRMGVWPAAVITSALFAAIHPTIPGQFLPLFGLAMVLAIVREKTGSLLPSMICHALNNLVTVLMVTIIS